MNQTTQRNRLAAALRTLGAPPAVASAVQGGAITLDKARRILAAYAGEDSSTTTAPAHRPAPKRTTPKAPPKPMTRAELDARLDAVERDVFGERDVVELTRIDSAMGVVREGGKARYTGGAPQAPAEPRERKPTKDPELARIDRAMGLAPTNSGKAERRGNTLYLGPAPSTR